MNYFSLKSFLVAIGISCFILSGCQSNSISDQNSQEQKDFPTPYSKGPSVPVDSMKGPPGPPPESSIQATSEKENVQFTLEEKKKQIEGFNTFVIEPLKLSFQYPKAWGEAKLEVIAMENSERGQIFFNNHPFKDTVFFVYNKKSGILIGDPMDEEYAPHLPVACDALKADAQLPFDAIDQCQSGDEGKSMTFHFPESDRDQEHYSGLYYTGNADYPYLILYASTQSGVQGDDLKKILSTMKEIS